MIYKLIPPHGNSSEMVRRKSCLLQNIHDLLLYAIFAYGMCGDLYYSLDMQPKLIHKVEQCLLPVQTESRESPLAVFCTQHIPYYVNAHMYL